MDVSTLQAALRRRGFDPGPIDGVWGRLSIAALKAFQAGAGMPADGYPGSGTLAALAGGPAASGAAALPVWYEEARRRLGLHETRDRAALTAWLRADGGTLGDPARLPWCGDFVATAIALTLPDEPLPANPYLARNWLRFGRPLAEPAPGAVAVFWRGSPTGSTDGHVAFYAGERDDAFRVLGGNQANAVSETWIGKGRLLGFRWPATVPEPERLRPRVSASGSLSVNEA